MKPAIKRFNRKFEPIADVLSRADIGQVEREALSDAMTEALAGMGDPDFNASLFRLISRDPLVACAGYDDGETRVPCPHGRELRIGMHDSSQPDGRNVAWRPRLPVGIRCVSCGSRQHVPGYPTRDEAVAT